MHNTTPTKPMRTLICLTACLTICSLSAQEPAKEKRSREAKRTQTAAQDAISIDLQPQMPGSSRRVGWSPKGAKVFLELKDGGLHGSFHLGPKGTTAVAVRLLKSSGATAYDRLWVDRNRDGSFGDGEQLSTQAKERRKKIWSSFSTVVEIPTFGESKKSTRPYPLDFWFVFDPSEPDAKPVLRWSRRGWHQGETMHGKSKLFVLMTERKMDGIFDRSDSWALAKDEASLYASSQSRSLATHAWFGEQAYKVTGMDPDGLRLAISPFDPGITRKQEAENNDKLAPDRRAKRAAKPLVFRHDFKRAEAEAAANKKLLFLDFETSWCGPCATMNKWVYTADAVVKAAVSAEIIAVKIDGSECKDLLKRFGVEAYPTMILLSPEGEVIRSVRGYRSVAEMTQFFAKRKD